MTQTEWIPSEQEIRSGQEAYIRYAGGIAIMSDPASKVAAGLHQLELTVDNSETIAVQAASLLYGGAKEMISVANPPEIRGAMARVEHNFDQALPNLQTIIDNAYDEQGARLEDMNPAFFAIRPAAMTQAKLYRYLCHFRLGKLQVTPLLDGFLPSSYFEGLGLGNRTLASLVPHRTSRHLANEQARARLN